MLPICPQCGRLTVLMAESGKGMSGDPGELKTSCCDAVWESKHPIRISISKEDFKAAIHQCELRCDCFGTDDIWDALLKPQALEDVVTVQESSESFFHIENYNITKFPEMERMIHLMVRRVDRKPIHSWQDLMRIKDYVLGEESEAVEIYPARSRLVDEDHIYHLWGLPKRQRFPFGMK